jgi:hypothetical protein
LSPLKGKEGVSLWNFRKSKNCPEFIPPVHKSTRCPNRQPHPQQAGHQPCTIRTTMPVASQTSTALFIIDANLGYFLKKPGNFDSLLFLDFQLSCSYEKKWLSISMASRPEEGLSCFPKQEFSLNSAPLRSSRPWPSIWIETHPRPFNLSREK